MPLLVGIDLVTVEEVRRSIADHGERYLSRVYTADELADADRAPARLAARFAAKEATMKALGRSDEAFGWREIAVARDADGRPSLCLSGPVASLARLRGVRSLTVSLTHEREYAAAVVVAEVGR
jgi:holo-[acyl-carrier protein] synthase